MKIVPDNWLANHLECDAFKLVIPTDCSAQSIQEALGDAQAGFYFTKVSTTAVAQVQTLEKLAFSVVDVNVTLEREPNVPPVSNRGNCTIRDYDPSRDSAIAQIGEDCFVYSRFHLDPRVSNDLANRIKREWVENSMAGNRGDRLLVAEQDGQAVGFLIELHTSQNGKRTTIIDLVGVDRHHQGRGIGRAMMEHVVRRSSGSADLLRVGTQVANVPSLRLYESTGFRTADTQYVLHAHL